MRYPTETKSLHLRHFKGVPDFTKQMTTGPDYFRLAHRINSFFPDQRHGIRLFGKRFLVPKCRQLITYIHTQGHPVQDAE